MEINKMLIRTFSILGQRGTFGVALLDIAKKDNNIFAMSADLVNTSGLDRFENEFPNRIINVGIAEQNLIGVAAGLADSGKIPFVTTFSNFASLRACECIRHFLGYMQCNVKVVGFGAGYAMEFFGNTHYGIDDISAIRGINNLTILSPADGLEVVKCVESAAQLKGPVYIRLSGIMNNPIVNREDYDFKIGKAIKLRDGSDISIYATGSMVHNALEAAEILCSKGIGCMVYNIHTIKPIDVNAIIESSKTKLVVTIEEHGIEGGLGSVVAEVLAENKGMPSLLRLGIECGYSNAGSYAYMVDYAGLSIDKLVNKIENRYTKIGE